MTDTGYLLSIDQGTTSTRALAFDHEHRILASAQRPLGQHYPANGWVEHEPEEIWQATQAVMAEVVARMAEAGRQPMALGITNQRETTLVWDRETGTPCHRAIVWQDRRTAAACEDLAASDGVAATVNRRTGLLLDPYFSATKLKWLLDDPDGPRLRAGAEAGRLLFGTVESFLVYRLTGGHAHVTDATNASRTMLADIKTVQWSDEMLDLFAIPRPLLPRIVDCTETVGHVAEGLPAAGVPIAGLVGDQQAASIGQACIRPGMVKSTYGTGCFVVQNTGAELVYSRNRLLSTVAYKTAAGVSYAMEGSIFNAGTVVQWCRDEMGFVADAAETEAVAASIPDTGGVYLVPAFTGLGAPHWAPEARGLITGITRDTGRAQMVRAGLESVAYQTADLLGTLRRDGARPPAVVRIDGGMAANGWFARFLADVCNVPVERPASLETTALGAALAAGVGVGLWADLDAAAEGWVRDSAFTPDMDPDRRAALLAGWQQAMDQTLAPIRNG
ncbi:glycerol kinase GlpK [Yunchengibacter salinarum]|uniref:glycerol kinase GlpK n=1 Tax=Yunchengibacter salinarum TaxID=3133399 RepID=UPI0035B61223